ncbi:GDP-mannose 4,6-dehydratase [Halobacteria archaeon AArc-dxtr1]|nr:GDP-mannose 4,6-dehydratase [Halobacteria archaeon AArc-dxtr1]
MQILVTGGAGFIGGHLAEAFVTAGHDVCALDNLDPFYETDIKRHTIEAARTAADDGEGSYAFVDGDVRDRELVADLVADADVVYHQAAQAGVRASVDDPHKTTEINVMGTLNVLEAARTGDVERVVLASSSSVYGKPESLPYDEAHPTTPVSPYGVSKLSGEHLARVYSELHDLPTVALRYFTVYGPRMRPNMAISNFVSRAINGDPPVIYGDGQQTRDFTHVDDIVGVNRQLLTDDAADGEVLNVGSTDRITIQELAETVCAELDPDLDPVYESRRTGDAEHTHSDISKAATLLGYEPSTSIVAGVYDFIAWYRENRDWYEPLVQRS